LHPEQFQGALELLRVQPEGEAERGGVDYFTSMENTAHARFRSPSPQGVGGSRRYP
jgi:hypothetical protein